MSGVPPEMRAQRHYRDFAAALIQGGFTIEAARHGGCGHLRVSVRRGARAGTVSLSSSPQDRDSAVRMAMQVARRVTR